MEVKVVQQEVKRLLDEIGHKQYLPAVRVIALILRGPIRRVIRAIHVKSDGLEQVWSTEPVKHSLYISTSHFS